MHFTVPECLKIDGSYREKIRERKSEMMGNLFRELRRQKPLLSRVSIIRNALKYATQRTQRKNRTASIFAFWPLRRLRQLRSFLAFVAYSLAYFSCVACATVASKSTQAPCVALDANYRLVNKDTAGDVACNDGCRTVSLAWTRRLRQ